MTKNPELNEKRRERRKNDPEYRARLNEYSRRYQAARRTDESRAKHRERTREYRAKNPHITFYTTSRYLAGKAGVFSDITEADALDIYELPNVCAYCGTDHGPTPEKRAIHIDHIIPMVQGGHNTRWNLAKVCISCNTSKDSASLIDFRERTEAFTQERYDAVVAQMARLSGKSIEEITHLLEQSHEFEVAYQRERERMVLLLSA